MDIQDKSKEELIIELQKLQRENESLKAFYSTSINELRQSERVLQDIIAKNPMSIQIIDKDGFTLLINSAHTKLFGAVPPNNYSVFTDPLLHKNGFSEYLDRAKAGEVILFPDFYYNVHDLFPEFPNVPVWIRMIIFPLYDKQGKPERYVIMHENISERKLVEEALRESEENHRNLLELAPHAFFQGDLKGNIILANEGATILTGFSKEELLNKNMKDFFSPSVLNNIPLRYDLLDKGETLTVEREITRKDGSIVIVEMRSRKMPNNTYQSFMSDISERKQAEVMLQKKNEEIEAQNLEYEELNEELIRTNIELSISKELIEESEKKYRLVFENVPLGIIHYNEKGEIISCNDRFVEIIGSSKEVLIGLNMGKLPDKKIVFALNQSLSGSLGYYYDDYHSITAAKVTPVQIIFAPIFSKKNEVIGGVGIIEDVTERKRNEEKLKKQNEEYLALNEELQSANEKLYNAKQIAEENEEKYSSIVKILPDGVIIHTAGNIVFMNDAALKIVKGKSSDDYMGKSAINFVHPDYRELALQRIKNSFVDKKYAELVEEAFIDSEGNTVNVLVAGSPFKFQGQPSMLTVFTDISKIKSTEQELIKAKEKAEEIEEIFNQFMKYSPIYVFFKDSDIRPILLSHNYEKMIGLPLNEILGKTMFELFPSELAKGMVEDDRKILRENKVFEVEEELNGRYYTTIKFPVHMKGKPRFLAGFTIDITERKQSELLLKEKNDELLKAKEKAEESDRLKTAFLANMSHEIRTPMNGILGFADLLKKPQLSGDQQKEYISIIEKSGIRMLNIINDIIDISKIESGEIKVSITDTNINEQINHILNFFKPEVERKGLALNLKSSLPVNEAIIRTDREKVYAILTNLVKNAIKFTDEGFIEIGCAKKGEFVEFWIMDTGIGIPKNRHQAVFERFVQADVSDSRAFQGAGLGLAITKAFVEMLGGRIWFESEEQSGSTFYFNIPNAVSKNKIIINENNQEKLTISSVKKLKVLVAEDDDASDLFITILLKSINCDVLHTKTGAGAVDICRKNPDLDFILMDIKMPEMNGYEATKEIRRFNNDVVIIAQTAHALAGDKEKAIQAGCNYYLSKPLNQTLLIDLIQKHFERK